MLKNTVGKGRSKDGSEIIIQRRVVARQRAEEGHIVPPQQPMLTKSLRGGAQPPIHLTAVVFAASSSIRVVLCNLMGSKPTNVVSRCVG